MLSAPTWRMGYLHTARALLGHFCNDSVSSISENSSTLSEHTHRYTNPFRSFHYFTRFVSLNASFSSHHHNGIQIDSFRPLNARQLSLRSRGGAHDQMGIQPEPAEMA